MRIHCTVRRSATRIHCTVRAINSQCAVRAVNIHVWSDSIASPFCNLFAWKIFPEWKHFVVSINVPPPQLWGGQHYTDGDFWRREHHGMFLSRGLKWYWGKIISPETKSRDLYSSRNIISNPKILGTFRDVPDNKVAICYIVWLPIALPGFGIARRNLQNSVFFSAGISFKLCAGQCVSIVLCAAVQRVSIVLCAQ